MKKRISLMALYRYFVAAEDVLPRPSGTLSSSISPAAIKQANEAVKSALTPVSKARGAYSKYTPEQQAMMGEYASLHDNQAAVRHFTQNNCRGRGQIPNCTAGQNAKIKTVKI